MGKVLVLAAVLTALLAGCGGGSKPPVLVVGAVDDAAKTGDASADVKLAEEAGLGALVLSAVWTRQLSAPPAEELDALRRAAEAADGAGLRPIVAVYQFSSATPLTGEDRVRFASYAAAIPRAIPEVRDVIVGNEPNLNLFWMPQFAADGTNAAAPAYFRLLAMTYDALKAVDEDINVIGGALAPRGQDDPTSARPTHSPTAFIQDLGAAYRASGRTQPILDMFDLHPYGTNSSEPTIPHPRTKTIGLADHAKLVGLLRQAFGTAPPIVYGEYGIETTVDGHDGSYRGTEPPSIRPVPPEEQGRRYADAVRRAACQPGVHMLLFFHVADEPQLERLQSGIYYANDTPKAGRDAVRRAIESVRDGCPRTVRSGS